MLFNFHCTSGTESEVLEVATKMDHIKESAEDFNLMVQCIWKERLDCSKKEGTATRR